MTVVLVMVVAVVAFGLGWLAHASGVVGSGARKRRRSDPSAAIDAGRRAIDEAQFAMEVAIVGEGRGIERELDQLRDARDELADAVGPEHPLTQDLEGALDALMMISSDLQSGGGQAQQLAGVVRDARARYRRAANAIAALPD